MYVNLCKLYSLDQKDLPMFHSFCFLFLLSFIFYLFVFFFQLWLGFWLGKGIYNPLLVNFQKLFLKSYFVTFLSFCSDGWMWRPCRVQFFSSWPLTNKFFFQGNPANKTEDHNNLMNTLNKYLFSAWLCNKVLSQILSRVRKYYWNYICADFDPHAITVLEWVALVYRL